MLEAHVSLLMTASQLNDRRSRYLMDQQIGLHNTIVSIALGVAGLAAASLFDIDHAHQAFRMLFWALWAISVLFAATIYSGMTANVYAAPNEIPGPQDMFLPFGLALSEFMLFSTLTSPLNSHLSPRTVVTVWFGCICLLGLFAALAIRRAKSLFEKTEYEPEPLQKAINKMGRQMRWDLVGATACSLGSLAAIISILSERTLSPTRVYSFALPTALGLTLGLANQRRQARTLRTGLPGHSSTCDASAGVNDREVPVVPVVDDKLERDRIPETIQPEGHRQATRVLNDGSYRQALLAKLIEEVQKVSHATAETLPGELADVLEALRALTVAAGISGQQLLALAKEKRSRQGRFEGKAFLESGE